jgi:hypothetical protein
VLIKACRFGSVVTQSHAVGAIWIVAYVEEIKNSLAEEMKAIVVYFDIGKQRVV